MHRSLPCLTWFGICLQVRLATVLDHVLDTVQHLLKKKVALERAIDPDTPDIIADGSRIVQVCAHAVFVCRPAQLSGRPRSDTHWSCIPGAVQCLNICCSCQVFRGLQRHAAQ